MAERKIGVAMDFSPSSKKALRWAIDNLVRRGDTLVLLHVRHHGREEGKNVLWSRTGSPLVPLEELMEPPVRQRYDVPYDAEVFDMLNAAARQKEMRVVVKMYWGDPREKVCDAVEELQIESLVMGSRGLGQIQRILLGSVTNYVLSNASCPVTVVKSK
ncbi:universal stress protein PHOS32 isoform X2 [Zea mays]|uniref:UspA domain-containing protein n=1 Tax=Zea mays TaxID=4577 RepID=A0A804QY06_MAIZE|nr:universal stress protein PHOS32 isoform X2 [Zea mays]|eukprot:XP_008657063.1 universal stress protein PHOS32 isoform X2 [Zea mays]